MINHVFFLSNWHLNQQSDYKLFSVLITETQTYKTCLKKTF